MHRLYQLSSLFLLGASVAGFPAYLRHLHPGLERWAISCAVVAFFVLVVAGLIDEFLAHFLNQPKGVIWGAIVCVFLALVCGAVIQG